LCPKHIRCAIWLKPSECSDTDRYGKDLKAEIAKLSISGEAGKTKGYKKEDQDGPDAPEYGARKH
jgi:hypothetical protein